MQDPKKLNAETSFDNAFAPLQYPRTLRRNANTKKLSIYFGFFPVL
jgi:hypothetical protein